MDYRNIEWWQVIIGSSLRYWIFAGITYLIFYIWKKRAMLRFRIQGHFPKLSIIKTEIAYSMSTIIIFSAVIYLSLFSPLRQHTKLYHDFHTYSVWYFVFTLILVVFLHDTYFYFMHRLMHWKKIFRYVHQVHHRSHNPTPLAAFSFHPLEAILEIAIVPLMVFTIPMHPFVLGIFGTYMILVNVVGHLGYELLPEKFMRVPGLNLLSTSTHHNMHHHYGRGNYGLYFNFWDKLLRTNHERYEAEFIRVSKQAKALKPGKAANVVG